MRKLVLAFSSILLVSVAFAQSTTPPAPPLSGTVNTAETTPPPRYEDNVRPLGGVQNFDLGSRTELFNLLTTAFDFSQSYGTNPGLQTGTGGETAWGGTTNVGGTLQLMRTDTAQHFSLSYRGAAQLNSYNSDLNTQIHALHLSESINAGRWNYVLGNDLSYEPNAFGANPPIMFPGTDFVGGGFRPGVGPDSTIFTEQNTRLTNTTVGQVTYGLSRISSLTANVSYGILHYTNNDFLDTRQLTSTANYNHRFGRNTIGMGYTYSRFMYSAADENFDTHAAEFSYGRRVIGRVSIEVAAGPTFTRIHLGPISSLDITANARSTLKYVGTRTTLSLGYSRAVTAGSGITPGALTDNVYGTASRRLSQSVRVNLSVGYARNVGTESASTYNSVYAATDITRDIGRYLSMSLGYAGQRQTSDIGAANLSSHAAVVSLHWRFRPVRLQ